MHAHSRGSACAFDRTARSVPHTYLWGVLAAVFVTAQASRAQCEAQRLSAGTPGPGVNFGKSLDVVDSTLAIGAKGSDFQGTNSGATYVFTRRDNVWALEATLVPAGAAAFDLFGYSVAVDANVVIVGTPYTNLIEVYSGSAYVFQKIGGIWRQTQLLHASDADEYDLFGYAVSLDDGTAIISASHDDEDGPYSGSVYVFERDADGIWVQTAKLTPSDGEAGNEFGRDVALRGGVLVVGAPVDDDLGTASGSAYIFERNNSGGWVEVAKLLASDGGGLQGFGGWVATNGTTALISATQAHGKEHHAGAVYVFERGTDDRWAETQKITASDGRVGDAFGWSVAVDGTTALIGAALDTQFQEDDIGSVYVFKRGDDGAWTQHTKLYASDYAEGDRFGSALALDGATAVIGAYGDDDFGNESGAAYLFDLAGRDCNANDRCDSVDIAEGSSADANGNGWPDECEASDCAPDLDDSGMIDLADQSALLTNFGPPSGMALPDGDLDGDGDVDLADLSGLLSQFGLACP